MKGKDIMTKFKTEFIIPYYDCNKFGDVRPISLLRYLGEASSLHSDDIGMGLEECKKMNYSWILYRWKVNMESYPKAKDKIIIETWTSSFNKFYAYREFIVYDEGMNEIGRARTLWIFMDTEKKRPIRIPKEFDGIYNIIEDRVFEGFWDLEEELEVEESVDFHVRKSDIDYNEHVNNSNYLAWIMEIVDEEVQENYYLREFEIMYKKETLYPETILSQRDKKIIIDDTISYNHKIINKENKEEKTIAKTVWKKR